MTEIGASSPNSFPGRSAAKSRVSSRRTGTHLEASEMSFLDKRILAKGYRCFHHKIALAISECRGWSAGGWFSLSQVRLTGVASQMTRPLSDRVLSGSIFGTLAMGTETTPVRRSVPSSSVISARPLQASFHSWEAASSRYSLRLGCGVLRTRTSLSQLECARIPCKAFSRALARSSGCTRPSKNSPCNSSKWSPRRSSAIMRRALLASFHPLLARNTWVPNFAASPNSCLEYSCASRKSRYFSAALLVPSSKGVRSGPLWWYSGITPGGFKGHCHSAIPGAKRASGLPDSSVTPTLVPMGPPTLPVLPVLERGPGENSSPPPLFCELA